MDQQLSETLAAQIAAKHAEALAIAENARQRIYDARDAAVNVGLLIDEAKSLYHQRLHEWLREYVPTLPVEVADMYHGVYRVSKRRECVEVDARQLKLIGIIGDDDLAENGGSNKGQKSDCSRWIKWTSHTVHQFRELEKERPIEQWESFEKKAVVDTLQPIVALFIRAGGVI